MLQKKLPAGGRAEKFARFSSHYALSQRLARSDGKSLMRRFDFWKI
jgi:hypothetical protein